MSTDALGMLTDKASIWAGLWRGQQVQIASLLTCYWRSHNRALKGQKKNTCYCRNVNYVKSSHLHTSATFVGNGIPPPPLQSSATTLSRFGGRYVISIDDYVELGCKHFVTVLCLGVVDVK